MGCSGSCGRVALAALLVVALVASSVLVEMAQSPTQVAERMATARSSSGAGIGSGAGSPPAPPEPVAAGVEVAERMATARNSSSAGIASGAGSPPAPPEPVAAGVEADQKAEVGAGPSNGNAPGTAGGGCMIDQEPRPSVIWRGEENVTTVLPFEDLVPLLNRTRVWPTEPGIKGVWASENKGGLLSPLAPAPPRECAREVPKLIHFVYLGRPLRARYKRNLAEMADKNPQWQCYLWVEYPLEQELADAFAAPALGRPFIVRNVTQDRHLFRNWDIISTIRGVAAAADMLRLEVVHLYGGIYMDVDSLPVHSFDEYGSLFRWPFVTYAERGGGICNCIFADAPGSLFLNFTIDVVREIVVRFGRTGPLVATGPPMVNSAFIKYNQSQFVLIESDYIIKHRKGDKQIMFQTFDYGWRWRP